MRRPYTILLEENLRRDVARVVASTLGGTVAEFMETAVQKEIAQRRKRLNVSPLRLPRRLRRGPPPREV